MAILIRPFEPRDRHAIRTLACDTADRGRPIDHLFRDRELVADLITRYYTDAEPQATWVAEDGGALIGYVTGCLDSRRYRRAMAWRIAPRAVLAAVGRGILWAPQTWRFVWVGAQSLCLGGLWRSVPLGTYPAHLHVNLRQAYRSQRVGRQLVEAFLTQLQQAGVRGIHVAVREDNVTACAFFTGLGFADFGRYPMVLLEASTSRRQDGIIYVKAL